MDQALTTQGSPTTPHVVIIGGGFAGLNLAQSLRRAPVRITLIDRQNHHLFQPLLYQVATAALSAPEIAEPIRDVLRKQENATVLLGEVTAIHPAENCLQVGSMRFAYDYLYIAAGASHSYFGQDHWAEFAPGLKTLDDALDIRGRMILAYERAERRESAHARVQDLTFVVVGAGPTGVELAGALAEIARYTMTRNFRNFDPKDARVLLIEAGDRVLAAYDEELSERARIQLEELGVEVMLGERVTDIQSDGVWLGEEFIPTSTVLWAAGVKASPVGEMLGVPLDRAGRVLVESDLTLKEYPNISVLGDLAAVDDGAGGFVPGLAPAAIQMGKYAAKRLRNLLAGKSTDPFAYKDKGQMATIGRRKAIAETARLKFSGTIAWLAWAVIHIYFLVGFRNRILVARDWVWHYLTRRRGARIAYGTVRATSPARLEEGASADVGSTLPNALPQSPDDASGAEAEAVAVGGGTPSLSSTDK